jgi:excisionase family DNA binding protein
MTGGGYAMQSTITGDAKAITPEELGQRLGVVRETILRQIYGGNITAHKIGGQWRILPRDVDEFLAKTSNQR